MSDLENEFHEAMIEIYRLAEEECHYRARFFLEMVVQKGGVNAARHLLASSEPQTGFTTLWECGRLDLTVEAHVIKPEYASLFTPEEINVARQRLADYGYDFDA